MEDLKNIIEGLLFVAQDPISLAKFRDIIPSADKNDIKEALKELFTEYDNRERSFYLCEVANGYQFRTRPEYAKWIKRLLQPKPKQMSKPAMETLAIVAYKQPVLRSDVEHIRGVDCGGTLRMLLEKNFIKILGRKEIPGRPLIYGTTKLFLKIFGLKNLKDLPSPEEISALSDAKLVEQTQTGQ